MNIRFVNNLTQHAKSGYFLTKINHNAYEFSRRPSVNRTYTKNKRNRTSTAPVTTTTTTTHQLILTPSSISKENILRHLTTKSPSPSKNTHIGNNSGDISIGGYGETEILHLGDEFSHKSPLDTSFVKNFDLRYKMQPSKIADDTAIVRLSTWGKKRKEQYGMKSEEKPKRRKEGKENEDRKSGVGIDRRDIGGGSGGLFIAAFTFSFFDSKKDEGEDDPSEKLITQIKLSILCIQREQYEKAEQMLHLALRMAQDLQNKEGITYIYDLMANLAMEREQYPKAEKLFADVMKRLFADGHGEDSPQVLHISSKLAHMAQLQGDLEKAHQGFVWTLERIGRTIQNSPEDKDLQELFGLTKNWFGQLLMKEGKYKEAKKHFEAAHAVLIDVYGSVNETAITILNNLSVACVNLDDYTGAKDYLNKALALVKELKDSTHEGILYANLGLIYLREGLTQKAKESCSLAYRIGKQQNNHDAIEQAEYCLNEVKSSL